MEYTIVINVEDIFDKEDQDILFGQTIEQLVSMLKDCNYDVREVTIEDTDEKVLDLKYTCKGEPNEQ